MYAVGKKGVHKSKFELDEEVFVPDTGIVGYEEAEGAITDINLVSYADGSEAFKYNVYCDGIDDWNREERCDDDWVDPLIPDLTMDEIEGELRTSHQYTS